MSYKGTKKKLPEIARELAVDGVVEGSVLREGNRQGAERDVDVEGPAPTGAVGQEPAEGRADDG